MRSARLGEMEELQARADQVVDAAKDQATRVVEAAASSPFLEEHGMALAAGVCIGIAVLFYLSKNPGEPFELEPQGLDDLMNDLKTVREPGATTKAKRRAERRLRKRAGDSGADDADADVAQAATSGGKIGPRKRKGKGKGKGKTNAAGAGKEAGTGKGGGNAKAKASDDDSESSFDSSDDSDAEGITKTVMDSIKRMPPSVKELVVDGKSPEEIKALVDDARRRVQRGERAEQPRTVSNISRIADCGVFIILFAGLLYVLTTEYGWVSSEPRAPPASLRR